MEDLENMMCSGLGSKESGWRGLCKCGGKIQGPIEQSFLALRASSRSLCNWSFHGSLVTLFTLKKYGHPHGILPEIVWILLHNLAYSTIKLIEGNGTNPDFNVQLSQALEQAKKNSMPRATVENAINQAKTSKLQSKQSFLELRGPAGSIFIVSILSDNTPRVKNDLHSIVRKSNITVQANQHCWLSPSEHQGAAQFVACFGLISNLAFVVSRLDLQVVLLQADIRVRQRYQKYRAVQSGSTTKRVNKETPPVSNAKEHGVRDVGFATLARQIKLTRTLSISLESTSNQHTLGWPTLEPRQRHSVSRGVCCQSVMLARVDPEFGIDSGMGQLDATFSNGGALRHEFDFKGVVDTIKPENLSLEIATDHAIEVGAEDVMQISLSDNLPGLQKMENLNDDQIYEALNALMDKQAVDLDIGGDSGTEVFIPHDASTS
uniref:TACO1/YebC-like N-terminal domain-containing protein n=1 Tax=Timema monikensis TaxID=170555 RepID=A0A7R9EJ44_9NEOP|nr:unnamed protein product [Timema monikensis]